MEPCSYCGLPNCPRNLVGDNPTGDRWHLIRYRAAVVVCCEATKLRADRAEAECEALQERIQAMRDEALGWVLSPDHMEGYEDYRGNDIPSGIASSQTALAILAAGGLDGYL